MKHDRDKYEAAIRQKQAEDEADKEYGREPRKNQQLTPRQKVFFEHADKLGNTLARIARRALKTSNDDMRDHALRGIQKISKHADTLEEELEEYI